MLKIAQRKTDDGANVLADIEAGAVSATYVTPGLDANMSVTTGGNTYYYTQDGLNSVRALTDSAGVVANNYDYLPFGGGYSPNTTATIKQRYTYTGRETNAVNPSMYYRNRFHSTSTGRFNRRDPIGYEGGVNQYSYVVIAGAVSIRHSYILKVMRKVTQHCPEWRINLTIMYTNRGDWLRNFQRVVTLNVVNVAGAPSEKTIDAVNMGNHTITAHEVVRPGHAVTGYAGLAGGQIGSRWDTREQVRTGLNISLQEYYKQR